SLSLKYIQRSAILRNAKHVSRGPRRSDNLTPEQRTRTMRAVKSRATSGEVLVAGILRARGVQYLEHGDLPGTPDFVIPRLRAALFVHGCFWHSHGCRTSTPKANRLYWRKKLSGNVRRDRRARR